MKKAYLLLRNNKQSGPFDLSEIIQMNLKPFDLIWVDGKSAGWRYPTEIETLKQYVLELETEEVNKTPEYFQAVPSSPRKSEPLPKAAEAERHIFVRLPGNGNSLKANLPAAEIPLFSPDVKIDAPEKKNDYKIKSSEEIGIDKKYSRSLNQVEEDYTNWVFKSKTKKRSGFIKQKGILISMVIFSFIIIALLLIFKQKMVATTPPAEPAATPQKAVLAVETHILHPLSADHNYAAPTNKKTVSAAIRTGKIPANHPNSSKRKKHLPKKIVASTLPAVLQNPPVQKPVEQKPADPVPSQTKPLKENKKGLAGVLNSLFSKIKKNPTEGGASPARIPDQTPGGRNARRRSGDPETSNTQGQIGKDETPALSEDLIELSSNEKNEEHWQLGIYNFKIALHNHNANAIKNATVSIAYFDENNRLLERKTINYYNVAAGGSQTVAAPDQKWADHLEYQLVAVQ